MPDTTIANGLIVATDESCKILRQSWPGIPTLVWPEGIDESASDWFRDLVIRYGVTPSTAHEYANILRRFLRSCRDYKRAWQSVDDEFIILWREHLRRGEGLSLSRINHVLKVIFAFYTWAEHRKLIRYRVGVYVESDLPKNIRDHVFAISAKRTFARSRSGKVFGNWTTPLTLRDPEQGRMRHTPNEREIRALHEIAVERVQGERDSLMMSYAEESGARRSEFLRIGKSDLPTREQLADIIEGDIPWVIMVKRKRGSVKPLHIPPDLISRTLDFIEFERREVVDHCVASIVGYREPDQVFLSSTTGLALHPDSVSSISRRVFAEAGVKNASIHRLRARFAMRVVEELIEEISGGAEIAIQSNAAETILTKAAEMMGHTSTQSLRPYINQILNRRIQTGSAAKAGKLDASLRQRKLQDDACSRRVSKNKDLHSVAQDINAGRNAKAAAELRRLADQLDAPRHRK